MFAKALSLVSFAVLATAQPWTTTVTDTAVPTAVTIDQCDTGDAQCCISVLPGNSRQVLALESLLGILVEDTDLPVGITCTPITVGVDGSPECSQQPVCCDENNFNGLITIGCTPISL